MKLFTIIFSIVLMVISIPMVATELLPKVGYTKSECKGFHTHELLEPYSVKIDSFKASAKWVDPQFKNSRIEQNIYHKPKTEGEMDTHDRAKEEDEKVKKPPSKKQVTGDRRKILLVYKGTITFEDKIEEIWATREMTRSSQTPNASIGLAVPIYQRQSQNPFDFLKRYQEMELAHTIERVELVVNKKGVLYDRPAAYEKFEQQRVRVQPVSLCITFDLSKLENRKSTSTTSSYAFQQFDGFRVAQDGVPESSSTNENETPDVR